MLKYFKDYWLNAFFLIRTLSSNFPSSSPSSPHALYLLRTAGNKASLASDQKGFLASDSLVCIKIANLV